MATKVDHVMKISKIYLYRRLRWAIFFVFAIFVIGLCLFFFKQRVTYQQQRYCLGAVVRIDIVAKRFQQKKIFCVFDAVWERLFEINDRFNLFNEHSDLSRINRSYPLAVRVDPETYEILERSVQLSRDTNGAFDPTIRALSLLWAQAEKEGQVPSDQEIRVLLKNLGVDQLMFLPDSHIQLLNAQVQVDLNAIIQGYAADEAGRVLLAHDINDFLIDAGGEILAYGLSMRSRPWTIGIKDPLKRKRFVDILEVSGYGVSTSGGYEKYFEIHNQRYSHLIDPKTGYPSRVSLSVTVIAPTTMQADVLSTALSVLDVETSMRLVKEFDQDIGVLILPQDQRNGDKRYFNSYYTSLVEKKQR